MSNINSEFIENYFKELSSTHTAIFGINKNADPKNIDYITAHEAIFSFINLLCELDESLKNIHLEIMMNDIISLLKQSSLSSKNTQNITQSYIEFTKKNNIQAKKDDTYNLYNDIAQKYKPTLDFLLNTKIYYLDRYICYKVFRSKTLTHFLRSKDIVDITSLFEYIGDPSSIKTYMKVDYGSFDTKNTNYDKDFINFVKSIKFDNSTPDKNDPLEQLIRYKKHISFFNGIEDDDIRDIVKDVRFRQYKEHEPIIKEKDTSTDIFFIVSGEGRLTVRGKDLGKIQEKTIFGEFSFITKQPRSATIKADDVSIVLSFNFDLDSFEKNPCLYSRLYKNISNLLVKKLLSYNY